ncbi:MAG: replication factor C large subunit [Candidatus Bathyarchaeia archaeon]|nr:replication factor C large subunit [Candidatus Bathyarchaeota archaeon]
MESPLTEKYRPKSLKEVTGNREAIQTLVNWLNTWNKSAKNKAALLHGPSGSGKTVTVEAASSDMGFDLIEMNASDERTSSLIEKIVCSAAEQATLTKGKRLILLDEVDGVDPSRDRGAVEAICSAIERTKWPIILTANNPWDSKLSPIRSKCLMIEFKRPSLREAIPYLKSICEKENLEVDDKALRFIVERNDGDMRAVLNDLQTLSTGRRKLIYEDVTWIDWRDRKDNIFKVLGSIFNAKTCVWARKAVELADVDYETLFEWIYENAPIQITDPADRKRALEILAKADLFFARIRRSQDWSLLPYAIDLMTAGVAMSREKSKLTWVKMKFPERIRLRSKIMKEKDIQDSVTRKIASECHTSTYEAKRCFVPYIKQILNSKSNDAWKVASWLDLDDEMINRILRTSAE